MIAYDNRGSGQSTTTPAPYDCAQLAADAVGLLDALEIERTDVFGMSLGGMIAQELALGWPERVDRLVLGCTHCGGEHAARPDREAGKAFALDTDDWAERMRLLAPFAFSARVDAEQLEAFVAKKSGDVQSREGYRGQIAAVLAHDTYDRLPGIECPTLILTGDDDRVIPGESSEVLARAHQRLAARGDRGQRPPVLPRAPGRDAAAAAGVPGLGPDGSRSDAFTSAGSPRSGKGISMRSKSRGTTVFSNAARASSRTASPP